jgi:hypothetical protein
MYSTDDLVQWAVRALRKMQKVGAAKVSFTTNLRESRETLEKHLRGTSESLRNQWA